MSPSAPTSVATTRPHCSRKTSSRTPELLLEHRTDLDRRCDVELLQLGGDGERAVEARSLDQDQAGEELLAVNERAVGQEHLSRLEPEGRRRLGRLQTDPAAHIGPLQDRGDSGVHLAWSAFPGRLGLGVVQQYVLHLRSLLKLPV